jgi:predicted glycoside hydrolase/deacetylase ChbG (UPF0249 family)
MQLSVNADDLGLSGHVNEESFALISSGLVDSASILTNAPASADALRRAARYGQCRFGVHLNVTQFEPLRSAAGLAPLLDCEGSFVFNILWRARKTRSLKRAVYLEWSAQIERFLDSGLKPGHLNSHHDVHLIPDFFPLVKRLQWQFGIRSVRRRNNLQVAQKNLRTAIRDELWAAASRISGSKIPDFVGAVDDVRQRIDAGTWPPARAQSRSVELIVHPGNAFDPVFQVETEMLRSGWVRQLQAQHGAAPARRRAVPA